MFRRGEKYETLTAHIDVHTTAPEKMNYFHIDSPNPSHVQSVMHAMWNSYQTPQQKAIRVINVHPWNVQVTGMRPDRIMQGARMRNGNRKIVSYSYVTFTHSEGEQFEAIISLKAARVICEIEDHNMTLANLRPLLLSRLRTFVLRPIANPLTLTTDVYANQNDTELIKYSVLSLE